MKLYKRYAAGMYHFYWNVKPIPNSLPTNVVWNLIREYSAVKYVTKSMYAEHVFKTRFTKHFLDKLEEVSLQEAIELGFDPSCLTPKEIVELRR